MLSVQNAVCGYKVHRQPDKVVLDNASLQVERGEVLCILGANGVGKTTLFKSILGAIPLLGGRVLLDGVDRSGLSQREVARKIGYVPQSHTPPFPFTVLQIVVMGRVSHLSYAQTPGKRDWEIAYNALDKLGIAHLADEVYTEISGGERQLALIARALTQEAELLIMDEPTSNLDFGNQIKVLRQICSLAESGIGVVFTSHFPNHAFLCASQVAVIKNKQELLIGGVDEIVTKDVLEEIYGIEVELFTGQSSKGVQVQSVVPYL